MAGKSDARVRYTQHALKQALLTLLKEKSVNKITVKEVCELAELNRATALRCWRRSRMSCSKRSRSRSR